MLKIIERLLSKFRSESDGTYSFRKESAEIDRFFLELSSVTGFFLDLKTDTKKSCPVDVASIIYLPLTYVESLREMVVVMYQESSDPIVRGYMSKSNLEFVVEYVRVVCNNRRTRKDKVLGKAAYMFYNLILKHPFTDGNKRTGLVATNAFLEFNGYTISKLPFRESEKFITEVARGKKSVTECENFIRAQIENVEISSELKERMKNIIVASQNTEKKVNPQERPEVSCCSL